MFRSQSPCGQSFPSSSSLSQSLFRPWPSTLSSASTITDAPSVGVGLVNLSSVFPHPSAFIYFISFLVPAVPVSLPLPVYEYFQIFLETSRFLQPSKIVPADMNLVSLRLSHRQGTRMLFPCMCGPHYLTLLQDSVS